jgi:uncharacterized membrane protein YgaE (UPF0421/DUF939 family)
MEIVYLIIGLILGGITAFFFFKSKASSKNMVPREDFDNLTAQVNYLTMEKARADTSLKHNAETITNLQNELKAQNTAYQQELDKTTQNYLNEMQQQRNSFMLDIQKQSDKLLS